MERSLVLPNSAGAFSAAFFDLKSNGNLDVIVSVFSGNSTSVKIFETNVLEDASFLTVKVIPVAYYLHDVYL